MSRKRNNPTFVLPERITPEFLTKMIWHAAPCVGYELCELGLLRRPHSYQAKGIFPGMLYYPKISVKTRPHYILCDPGEKIGTRYTPDALMFAVFGKFRNAQLDDYAYQVKLRALVKEYNTRYFRGRAAPLQAVAEERVVGMEPKRKCTDCGQPTRNYRCEACWILRRKGFSLEDIEDSAYSVSGIENTSIGV